MRVVVFSMLLLFVLNADELLLKKAQEFEQNGNYKEAMLIYKQIALKKPSKPQNFIEKKEQFLEQNIEVANEDTKESLRQIVSSDFALHPYEKNFFVPLSFNDKKGLNRKKAESVFQISFKKPLLYDFFGFGESIELAYTQISFWQTFSHSLPFRETNYSPEAYVLFLNDKKDSHLKAYKFGFIHNSNGKGGTDSRTWNRLYAQGTFLLGDLFITPKIWYKFHENGDYETHEDNPDILKYYGYGELLITYPYKKHIFELLLRDNFRKNNKGFAKLEWTHPISNGFDNFFWYANSSYGYGDSLIDYNNRLFRVSFGVAFSR